MLSWEAEALSLDRIKMFLYLLNKTQLQFDEDIYLNTKNISPIIAVKANTIVKTFNNGMVSVIYNYDKNYR